jgi:EAL domain-containing protein (putative c-di-GMP-specific phosphodiesterase class I)
MTRSPAWPTPPASRSGWSRRCGVIGEGIETPAQLETPTEMSCQYGQGNLLGPPVRPDELAEMLKARNAHPAASKGPQS